MLRQLENYDQDDGLKEDEEEEEEYYDEDVAIFDKLDPNEAKQKPTLFPHRLKTEVITFR